MDDPAVLAITPAAAPPPGEFTNFVNPPSQQGTIIAVCSVMMVFTLLFVCLRLYSNFRVTQSPGVEDCKYFPHSAGQLIDQAQISV